MRPTILKGKKVSLAVSLSEDKEKWLLWVNDREIQNMVGNPMRIYFESDFDEILEELRKSKEKMVNFAVVENEKEELVGFCGIGTIDWRSRKAVVWYFIGKEHWGKGYGTETLALLCRFAFENMNLRKLYTYVYEPNRASIRVLEKNGFKLAGRLEEHTYLPGYGYVDELIYELLEKDWKVKNDHS